MFHLVECHVVDYLLIYATMFAFQIAAVANEKNCLKRSFVPKKFGNHQGK